MINDLTNSPCHSDAPTVGAAQHPQTQALLSEYYWRYSCFLAQSLYSLLSSTGDCRQAQLPGPS